MENASSGKPAGPQDKFSHASIHTSHAISLARILLVVGLIFLHYGSFPNSDVTPFNGYDTTSHRFATWANSAILFFFFSAVPLLSMISGWLFFSFQPDDAWPVMAKRMRRRFISLYMPLVVWNMAYLVILYTLFITYPNLAFFTHSNRFSIHFVSAGWTDYFNAMFAVTNEPVAFQFWFVRDLFVTCLISPVLWLMIRYMPWLGALGLFCAWISGMTFGIFLRLDVPFFFYMGGLVYQHRIPYVIPRRRAILLAALYIALVGLRALSPLVVPADAVEPFWLVTVTRLMRIVGVLSCWGVLYRLANTHGGALISGYGGLAFFLHSAHWPLLAVVKIAVWRFIPFDNDFWMLTHLLLSVTLTAMIGLAAGLGLAKQCPRIFALMNGGRVLGQVKDRHTDNQLETKDPVQSKESQEMVFVPANAT